MSLTGTDSKSLALQFGFVLLFTLLYTYGAAFFFRRWTYIRKHSRVLIGVVVASILGFAFYRISVLLNANFWVAFVVLLFLWAFPVNAILYAIDGRQGLIDTDPQRKVLFRTDYRVTRIASHLATLILILQWSDRQ
jgi:hypothetical protein